MNDDLVTKEYIDDRIELRSESAIQAMNAVLVDSFSSLESRIHESVESTVATTVDVTINGKLKGLKADNEEIKMHLKAQDNIQLDQGKNQKEQGEKIDKLLVLLEERKFRHQLYDLAKKLFAGLVSLGGAWLLLKEIVFKMKI